MAGGGGAARPRPGDWSPTIMGASAAKRTEPCKTAGAVGGGAVAAAANGQAAPALDFFTGAW
jgi:hypothetical protein